MSERCRTPAPIDRQLRELDARLGAWLCQQRHLRGLTLKQLGHMLGISYQQVKKYETGTNRLTAARLLTMLDALQLDLATLTTALAAQQPPRRPPARQGRLEGRLLERVARLTPEQQRGLLALLETAAEDVPRSWLTPELVAC